MDDKTMVGLMRAGDTRGLEAVIEKYRGLACSIATSVLGKGSREDVLECVNSAFFDVWLSMSEFDSLRSSLKGWVALLTRRRAIDQLRKNIGCRHTSLDDFPAEVLAEDTCHSFIQREALINLFNEFVQGLTEPDRSIFVRRFFVLESIPAIARRYNLTRGAVDNRLSRMRKSLKQVLEGSEAHEG